MVPKRDIGTSCRIHLGLPTHIERPRSGFGSRNSQYPINSTSPAVVRIPAMEKPFVFFGTSHVTAIALTLAAPLALAAITHGREHLEKTIRWALAALLAANWIGWMFLL